MKDDIRKYAKEYRKSLNTKELSKKIHQNLFLLDEWKKSENVFCYYSVENEVNTTDLFSANKNWYIPRINSNELCVCHYEPDNLVCNKYNIPEPTSEEVDKDCIDLIIIPALAADINGYRIGYGGGYYDRFLSNAKPDILKVVFIYSDLLFESVYPEDFDIKCDIVVTDKDIYKINC